MKFFTTESRNHKKEGHNGTHASKRKFFQPPPTLIAKNSQHFVQRSPLNSERDPIHQPIIDQFRRETDFPGMSDELRPSDAYIKYVLVSESLAQRRASILNNHSFTDSLYAQIVAGSPDQVPLWPSFTTRNARINFIRFLIREDPTNCRPYDTAHPASSGCAGVEHNQEVFSNLCMGFATQFYVRHTDSSARLSGEEVTRLQNVGHIYAGAMLPKFRVPVFLAIYPGHAFNAFLIESNAADINSYVFLEPQNDQLFTASDPLFSSYFAQGMITINRLTGFNETGQYQTAVEHTFAERAGVPAHAVIDAGQRMALTNLSAALHIAYDPNSWRYTIEVPQLTFESNFQRMATMYTDEVLAAIFPYLNGRKFKRTPASAEEILTRVLFIQLAGRNSLERAIRP